jgi:hypothetical protein
MRHFSGTLLLSAVVCISAAAQIQVPGSLPQPWAPRPPSTPSPTHMPSDIPPAEKQAPSAPTIAPSCDDKLRSVLTERNKDLKELMDETENLLRSRVDSDGVQEYLQDEEKNYGKAPSWVKVHTRMTHMLASKPK